MAHAYTMLFGNLPLIDLEMVIGSDVADSITVDVKALATRAHNCSAFSHFALATIVKLVAPRTCIEIGTYDGRSALAIAANIGEDGIVYTLNLPPQYLADHPELRGNIDVALSAKVASGERWTGLPEQAKIRQLFGNSRDFEFAEYFPAQLFFIDGGHDSETVLSDSRMALSGIDRKNGAILWDDAQLYGVPMALKVLIDEGYPIRVLAGTGMALLRFYGGQPIMY